MSDFRWSKYVISSAKYGNSNILLVEFCIHRDSGSTIGPGIIKNRTWLLSQLISGSSFCTAINHNGQWYKGEKVILNHVAGRLYINTRPELQPGDDLGTEIVAMHNYIT